jgi:hypothetical protein
MAKKKPSIEVNKSQLIRELLTVNPKITLQEASDTLARQGIEIKQSLFYIVKGRLVGRKGRRKKSRQAVAAGTVANGSAPAVSDVLGTINKVKAVAAEVGGLKKLKSLLEALSE